MIGVGLGEKPLSRFASFLDGDSTIAVGVGEFDDGRGQKHSRTKSRSPRPGWSTVVLREREIDSAHAANEGDDEQSRHPKSRWHRDGSRQAVGLDSIDRRTEFQQIRRDLILSNVRLIHPETVKNP